MKSGDDARWMRRALAVAARGSDLVSPNPMVGAVLVREGAVVGEGFHRAFGGPHAEVEAINQAGRRARGATLYVTLEPCTHHGKQPPCAPALVTAGVGRVQVALRDPNPDVSGDGVRVLRAAGIETAIGLLEASARDQNVSFLKHVLTGTPLVRWKCATSFDGRIGTRTGDSRWITGPRARRHGHQLRAWADAMMVGIETILVDDPELTVRGVPRAGKPILRVVLDSQLRTPPSARIFSSPGGVVVFTVPSASARRRRALERAGAEVVAVRSGNDGLSVRLVLKVLGARGVGRLLVEGGGRVVASLLRARSIDRVTTLLAPVLIGGDGVAAVGPLDVERVAVAPRLVVDRVRRLGPDLVVESRTSWGFDSRP